MDLINIRAYDAIKNAEKDKLTLAAYEIESFISDKNNMQKLLHTRNAIGDFNLLVAIDTLEISLEILNIKPEKLEVAYKVDKKGLDIKCPNCGSNNVYKERSEMMVFEFLLKKILETIFPKTYRKYICYYCEYEWTN